MFSLSIQRRQLLAKLMLPLFVAAACVIIVLGQADKPLIARLRLMTADFMAPAYALVEGPLNGAASLFGRWHHLFDLVSENDRLRKENRQLQRWQQVAISLSRENKELKGNLKWVPENAPSFVTARAVADTGGVYARSVIVATPSGHEVKKGGVVLDGSGLVGRVTDVGQRSVRVLLVTDSTSRIPVEMDDTQEEALMVGDNTALPRLMYYADGVHPREGGRIVTGKSGNVLPQGLPVGTIHYVKGIPRIIPYANLEHIDIIRIFDYGLASIEPPPAAGRAVVSRRSVLSSKAERSSTD